MTQDILTVVTATLGSTAGNLAVSMEELRDYTDLPFIQIVSDDGTYDDTIKDRQRRVVQSFRGSLWTENPGPIYGISYNLNYLFSLVKTPWAFVLEDAVRPGRGWLETAMDALEKIGTRKWRGHEVGGIGLTSSFDHWEMQVAGMLGDNGLHVNDFFGRVNHDTYNAFWGPDWNDGLVCWPRLLPKIKKECADLSSQSWHEDIRRTWRDPLLRGELLTSPFKDTEHGRRAVMDRWPATRRAWPSTSPGSWGLVNMDIWRKVNRWRDGCTFYEGHLGVRLAQNGYLSVNIHNPPWLHYPSLAFNSMNFGMGKNPRHHEPDNGPDGVFERDFGCNGVNHCDLRDYTIGQYPPGELEAIAEEMATLEMYADPVWREWM